MKKNTNDSIFLFRRPQSEDGKKIREIAKKSKSLDMNSLYHYLIMCSHFSQSSMVVETKREIIGFVTAYPPPETPDTLFIWQVAVAAEYQGKGLGVKLLLKALGEPGTPYKYLNATITPSNTASIHLFKAVAIALNSTFQFKDVFFKKEDFGSGDHEAEILFHIGPIQQAKNKILK